MTAEDAAPAPAAGTALPAVADVEMEGPLQELVVLACRGVNGCDAAGVTMARDGAVATVAASRRLVLDIDDRQYASGDGPCLTAFRDGCVVDVADYATDQRWPAVGRAALGVGMRSSLSLPLLDEGRLLGALNLYGRSAGCFDAEAHRIAKVVARQAATAIRYVELLQVERQGRRAEQRIAHELQRSLLPAVPDLPGISCAARYAVAADAARVGGDWYDVFGLPDGAVGVAVGDVMGHDVAAAAAMGQLRSVLRSYAYEGGSPSSVLDRLDRLVQGFDMAQLATTLYGRLVLDRCGAMLLYCNAGHLPPLVRLPDGTAKPLVGAASRLIGAPLDAPVPRTEAAAVLPTGSMLVLYTDGLVEHRGRDIDEGIDALCRTLSREDPDTGLEGLCDRLLDDAAGDGQDDVALLLLRVD